MALLRAHNIILVGIILLGIIFIYPFAITLLLAAVTSYALYPLVNSLRKIIHSYNLALAISLLTIIIPSFYLLRFAAGDISPLIHDMRLLSGDVNVLIGFLEAKISAFGLERYTVEMQDMLNHITDYMISGAATFFQSIPRLLLNIAIYIFATYHFIKDGGRIVNYVARFIKSLETEDRLLFTSLIRGLKKSFDVLFLS
ncbi:MAG: AI-2E family transporter, partial [Candidatus Aenigmarchaeota archaeon]|nr:AI-2E family transporter [Candidatus Aenigmarchaeota archaeon]